MNKLLTAILALFTLISISVLADENLPTLKVGSDVYRNVTVTTVTATDIYFTFNNGAGMANAKLKDLDADLQKHFNYNPAKAGEVEEKQAQANWEYHSVVISQAAAVAREASGSASVNLPALPIGSVFPDFFEKDLYGNSISVSNFRGKVVLVDFWATWCPACRGDLPDVIDAYKKYHADGFEIIGVSLDDDFPTLTDFIKSNDGMSWSQFYDGLAWHNKLALEYGIPYIPFTVLIGPDGKILAKELRGGEIGQAVAQALGKSDK